MAASYDQMTCVLIKQYLGQCVDRTIALPQVAFEILTFLTVEKSLKKAHSFRGLAHDQGRKQAGKKLGLSIP